MHNLLYIMLNGNEELVFSIIVNVKRLLATSGYVMQRC